MPRATERIVRLDLFRMACVVESFASCLLALTIGRATASVSQPYSSLYDLGERQQQLRGRMLESANSLVPYAASTAPCRTT